MFGSSSNASDASTVGVHTLGDALRAARLRIGTTHSLRVLRDGKPLELVLSVVPQAG